MANDYSVCIPMRELHALLQKTARYVVMGEPKATYDTWENQERGERAADAVIAQFLKPPVSRTQKTERTALNSNLGRR